MRESELESELLKIRRLRSPDAKYYDRKTFWKPLAEAAKAQEQNVAKTTSVLKAPGKWSLAVAEDTVKTTGGHQLKSQLAG